MAHSDMPWRAVRGRSLCGCLTKRHGRRKSAATLGRIYTYRAAKQQAPGVAAADAKGCPNESGMTVEPGITVMPERIGHDNRAGNDGAGWLSDHQPLPDCSGGFWAAEMLEDLEAEVDGAAGSTACYDGSVGNGRGLDIFCTFCE